MMRGLWSGVSGLQNNQVKMDVIGNNIANINTTGFKKDDVIFTDFISELHQIAHGPQGEKGGTGPQQIGLGSSIGSITTDFSQGALQRTDRTLDTAVQGSGYFVVADGDANYYTRNGHFELDSNGTVVYGAGMKVQGWQAAADPVTGDYVIDHSTKPIGDMQIKVGDVIPARATTNVKFNGNLNSDNIKAIDSITVEWSAGSSASPTSSKVKIEFEHAHPTDNYYVWKAKWAENPPAGFEVGDSVIDQNTGRAATGIIQLDDTGKVIGNFINTNSEGVINASVPQSSSNNGVGNIKLGKVEVRNQYDTSGAKWKIVFQQNGGTFDENKYDLMVSTDDGENWTTVTDIKDANDNTLTRGDIRTNTVFTYTLSAPNSRKMYGQITILASDWTGEASNNDTISFTTGPTDTTTEYNEALNLNTEIPKEEDDWPAMVATKPVEGGNNNTNSGSLKNVNVNRSVKIDTTDATSDGDYDNITGTLAETNLEWDPTVTGHVAVDGYVAPGANYRIELDSNYNGTTNKKFYLKNASDLKTLGEGEVGVTFNQKGVYIPSTAWKATPAAADAGKYIEFKTKTIDPGPNNYKITFTGTAGQASTVYTLSRYDATTSTWKDIVTGQSKDDDLNLDKGIKSTAAVWVDNDGNGTNDYIQNQETLEVPWSNWTGVFTTGDEFYFDTHASVSQETGHRDFIRIKDKDGNISEIFIPSGSQTGADPIAFGANTSETSTATDESFQYAKDMGTIKTGIALGGAPVTATLNNVSDYQYVTNINVYDSLGKAHNTPITFERKSDNLWMWSVNDPTPDDPNNVGLAGYGLLAFNADGTYDAGNSIVFNSMVGQDTPSPNGPLAFQGIYFDPSDWGGAPVPPEGANPVKITPDFTDLVQYSSTSDAEIYSQDGYSKGTLTEYAVDQFGVITGLYDNGYSRDIAQIALANFNNDNGLLKQGGSLYRTTSNSGNPRVGVAGTGGRGTVASGNLEQSNVDLASEFTSMIVTQRGFQANSRTITTEDQLLQELLSLKR